MYTILIPNDSQYLSYSRPRNTNRFSVEVNVGAQEKVVFNLTYQELLKRKRGSYEHVIYINPKQIVADFQIHVSIEESRELTEVRVPPIRNELEQKLEIKGMIVKKATIHSVKQYCGHTVMNVLPKINFCSDLNVFRLQ